jgi:hypothetical protein
LEELIDRAADPVRQIRLVSRQLAKDVITDQPVRDFYGFPGLIAIITQDILDDCCLETMAPPLPPG